MIMTVILKGGSRTMASTGTLAWLPGSWRDAHSCANSSMIGKSLVVQVPGLYSCSLETLPKVLF